MSQSDKTRQKLVDSMRKTKSGATGKNESAATNEPGKVQAQKSKSDSTTRAKPASRRSGNKSAAEPTTDSYQSVSRRVWPD